MTDPIDPDFDPTDPPATDREAADLAAADQEIDPLDELDSAQVLDDTLDVDVDEYAEEMATLSQLLPAADLTDASADAPKFYESTADLHALDGLSFTDRPSVLERLGPAHFRSKGFSFMGFLQTVYDHVAVEMKPPAVESADPAAPAQPATTLPQAEVPTETAPAALPAAAPEIPSPGAPEEG